MSPEKATPQSPWAASLSIVTVTMKKFHLIYKRNLLCYSLHSLPLVPSLDVVLAQMQDSTLALIIFHYFSQFSQFSNLSRSRLMAAQGFLNILDLTPDGGSWDLCAFCFPCSSSGKVQSPLLGVVIQLQNTEVKER